MHKKCSFLLLLVMFGCTPQFRAQPGIKDIIIPDSTRETEILATGLSFDINTGEIKYTLPEPGFVRLRVGLKDGGPTIKIISDWERKEAGSHIEMWDKKDTSGFLDFTGNTNLMMILKCVKIDAMGRDDDFFRRNYHPSPKFNITFPLEDVGENGTSRLKGKSPVKVVLDEVSRGWFTKTKYEMVLFIDNAFLIEDEEASDPFTYQLDTTKLNNGVHVLTVNVVGYTGDVGVKSVAIDIQN